MTGSLVIKALTFALLLCALLSAPLPPAFSQKSLKAEKPDRRLLRRSFDETFTKDFERLKDELTTRSNARGGGTYWLVRVRPKRSGSFYLKHRYKYKDSVHPKDPLYSYVEQELRIEVGERGCRRSLLDAVSYMSVCLGDTVILPFLVNNFTEHTFSLKSQYAQPGDVEAKRVEPYDEGLLIDSVNNPASQYLKYVGRRAHLSPHRAPGYTLSFSITFEAQKPGRFNLTTGARLPNGQTSAPTQLSSYPIIIVDKDTPITVLASHEEVYGYNQRQTLSSTSGNSYITSVIILQTGESLSLPYYSVSRRGISFEIDKPDKLEEIVPIISQSPFHIDLEYNHNEWVINDLLFEKSR